MVKQIILVIECCMGYAKAVYLIGVPQWGTKSIKWNSHVFKVQFCLAQKIHCNFFLSYDPYAFFAYQNKI